MPKQYEAIKKKYLQKGEPVMKAKEIAARIYNALHPDHPNPWAKEKKRKRRKKK